MVAVEGTRELRALQAKAYGREGGLTAAEARRLAELESPRGTESARGSENERISGSAPEDAAPNDPVPNDRASNDRASKDTVPIDPAADVVQRDTPAPSARPEVRSVLRTHLKAVILASLAILLVGLAAGWAVFGGLDDEPRLTAGQQERRLELQGTEEYDEDSVRLIAEDDDTVVWYATRSEGEIACVVLDVGAASQEQCGRLETVDTMGLSVSLSVPASDPEDPADQYGTTISAVVGYTTAGDPLAWIQEWSRDASMLDQFAEGERDRAEALLDEGYLPVPTIVGYFHDEPVWLAERPTDGTQSGGIVRCMLVDAVSDVGACQPSDGDTGGLRAVSIETADDGTPVLWTLHIRFTKWQNPYLTIEQGEPSDVGVSYVELGGEHGDPILVEVPSSESGG